MVCRLCQSDAHLEEISFGNAGRAWICTHCYNNPLLREQMRGKFQKLFEEWATNRTDAAQRLNALARQYKLPDPEIF